jgi:hypothetical protein
MPPTLPAGYTPKIGDTSTGTLKLQEIHERNDSAADRVQTIIGQHVNTSFPTAIPPVVPPAVSRPGVMPTTKTTTKTIQVRVANPEYQTWLKTYGGSSSSNGVPGARDDVRDTSGHHSNGTLTAGGQASAGGVSASGGASLKAPPPAPPRTILVPKKVTVTGNVSRGTVEHPQATTGAAPSRVFTDTHGRQLIAVQTTRYDPESGTFVPYTRYEPVGNSAVAASSGGGGGGGQQQTVQIASGRTVPVGATGTAQGGRYVYQVQADGSVVELNSGRVTSPPTSTISSQAPSFDFDSYARDTFGNPNGGAHGGSLSGF